MSEYRTIKENALSEIVERKSRFIAQIFFINNVEEAESIIKSVTKKYYDAKHNCFAYNILNEKTNEVITKISDDGEPCGTAGIPIMNAIKGCNLMNVLVIVTRYFGGILLGTGGLVRAYKDATEKVIDATKKYSLVRGYEIEINLEYNELDIFNYYCKINNINILKVEYLEKIKCIFEICAENFNEKSLYYSEKDIVRQKLIISEF